MDSNILGGGSSDDDSTGDVSSDDELVATAATVLRAFITGKQRYTKTVATWALVMAQLDDEDSEEERMLPRSSARDVFTRALTITRQRGLSCSDILTLAITHRERASSFGGASVCRIPSS